MAKKIFIVSGEESGDNHGALLIDELKKITPDLSIIGMGGRRMKEAGQIGVGFKEVSVVGLAEVVKRLPVIKRVLKGLKETLRREKPDCVVLIDFPDFNLRLAAEAKRLGIPVVYYISPQVWAWRRGRVKRIANLVDKMLVLFSFEVPIYEEAGVDVEFVGHPLVDKAVCDLTTDEAKQEFGFRKNDTVCAILPGSRTEEVEKMLPVFKDAIINIKDLCRWRLEFILPAADNISDAMLEGLLKDFPLKIKVVRGELHKALRASDAAIVTSGTATLETALIGTPMVIVYKVAPLTYHVGKMLIKVKHVGLPNIIAGRKIVPELLQKNANSYKIAEDLLTLFEDAITIDIALKGYKEVAEKLGEPGGSRRAAKAVAKVMGL